MIRIRPDMLKILKAMGYNTGRLKRESLLPESTCTKIRHGGDVTLKSIERICNLTGLEPKDIIDYEYEPYTKGGE